MTTQPAQTATPAGPADPDADAAVRQVVADAEREQNSLNELTALHTSDTVIVNIAGRRVLGRDAFSRIMKNALATPLAKITTTVEVQDVRFVRPDVAIVSCAKRVNDGRDPVAVESSPMPAAGVLTYVIVREDGAWRIALAQTTPSATA